MSCSERAAMMKSSERKCSVCSQAATSTCGSCKVAPFCSRECQKLGWKYHKKRCALNDHSPADWIAPTVSELALSQECLWISVPTMPKGLPDPRDPEKARTVLLSLLQPVVSIPPLVEFDPRVGLEGWTKPHSELLAGYCGEDQADYILYYDSASEADENAIAAQLLMHGGVRGSVVVGLTRAEERFASEQEEEAPGLDERPEEMRGGGGMLELSTVDIAGIVVERTAAALAGGVTDRIHRANMRRAEMQMELQNTKFTPIDL